MPWPKGKPTWNKGISNNLTILCKICNKEFSPFPSTLKGGGGKYCSQKCFWQIIGKTNLGSKNGMWKGDSVGYVALHEWIKNRLPKPKTCMDCHKKKPIDLANISQEYKRDLSDWEWLCRSCHMKKDGRIKNLKNQW